MLHAILVDNSILVKRHVFFDNLFCRKFRQLFGDFFYNPNQLQSNSFHIILVQEWNPANTSSSKLGSNFWRRFVVDLKTSFSWNFDWFFLLKRNNIFGQFKKTKSPIVFRNCFWPLSSYRWYFALSIDQNKNWMQILTQNLPLTFWWKTLSNFLPNYDLH